MGERGGASGLRDPLAQEGGGRFIGPTDYETA